MMRKLMDEIRKSKPRKRLVIPPRENEIEIDPQGNIMPKLTSSSVMPEEVGHSSSHQDSKSGSDSKNKSTDDSSKEGDKEENLDNDKTPVLSTLDEIKQYLEQETGFNSSFDLIMREMVFGSVKVGIFYANGFAKDSVLTDIITRLSYAPEETIGRNPLFAINELLLPHIQVKPYSTMAEIIGQVLSGSTAIFIEGESTALAVDAKVFPARTTEEPDLERVVRGARDGFVETLLTNVTLIRRRIRDPKLKLEIMQVGRRTKTDVCMAYIDDIADPELVKAMRSKIEELQVDGLPLAEKELEEMIIPQPFNPYPTVRYSERPDVIATHLLEGHVAVVVDTSPSVMILPTTFFHHVQHAEEYRQNTFMGTYLRWVRFLGILASLILLPLWYLMVIDPIHKPEAIYFIGPEKTGDIPIIMQFIIAELGIDLLRMASVHTPSPLTVTMGLVAAILIGEIAVKTGLFINEVILYFSIASIGMFSTPSYELGLANRIARLLFLIAVSFFKGPGLVVAVTFWLLYLTLLRSYNSPYMWPFIPFNAMGFYSILIRRPITNNKTRLSLTKPIDSTRQPSKQEKSPDSSGNNKQKS